MKAFALVGSCLLLALPAFAQEIPTGTTLPVMLKSSLNSSKDRPQKTIQASLMQEVTLPSGTRIPAGALVAGQVVEVQATPASGSHLAVRFDRIIFKGHTLEFTASLRALASKMQVFEAQMPTNSFDDYGTTVTDWNTIQVGGDAVYRGNGEVLSYGKVIGRSSPFGAVSAKLEADPRAGCHNGVGGNDREQALWVFSAAACGIYGFEDLKIAHAGRTNPIGLIVLESPGEVKVDSGSGWLLRVVSSLPGAASPTSTGE
jgi:hypothetical protein